MQTRTQRRLEHRQMWMMAILMAAVTVASFFLGVMVGERSASVSVAASEGSPTAQVAPPPPPPGITAPRKLTFYEDLPKGNAAPLGSGINLPKGGGYAAPVYPPAVAPTAMPQSAPAPPPASTPPAVAAPPAPVPASKAAPAKSGGGGAYVVQVISTKSEAEARKIVGKLQGAGISVRQERVDLGAKGVWFRVVAGPYDQEEAGQVAGKLKKQKYAAIVRKK